MHLRTLRRLLAGCSQLTAAARWALLGLTLIAAVSPALASSAGAATPGRIAFWTRCSLSAKLASIEVFPVEVLDLTCGQADSAIRRGRVLLTPGGPIFSTRGYTCSSKNILPRFDPSPIELPAVESCTGANRQLRFIWNYAS